jgi:RluA family pseudouridine synthase
MVRLTAKEGPVILMDFLLRGTGSSRTKIRHLLKRGAVSVNGTVERRADAVLSPGTVVEVSKVLSFAAKKEKPHPVNVLYEDEFVIAAAKPAGMLSIATRKEKTRTFYRAVSDYVKSVTGGRGKIFIVHRLDREVSGVMLFARDEETKRALQDNWERTEKTYHALVEGLPSKNEGVIEGWLCESSVHKVYPCRPTSAGAQYAVTGYKVLARYGRHSLLEVSLRTGRKHQIRVQLSELGFPVVGDKKYGANTDPLARIGLHASRLAFTHPRTGKRVTVFEPPPEVFYKPY